MESIRIALGHSTKHTAPSETKPPATPRSQHVSAAPTAVPPLDEDADTAADDEANDTVETPARKPKAVQQRQQRAPGLQRGSQEPGPNRSGAS